jgi:hypothetical protein
MVNQQRWLEAMSCLSWITGHGQVVIRPAVPEMGLAPAAFCIRQPGDLGAYWYDQGNECESGENRGLRGQILGVDYATETSAMVRVELSANLNRAGAGAGGETRAGASAATARLAGYTSAMAPDRAHLERKVCFGWPVYQWAGQWYLLQIGFPAPKPATLP